MKQIWTIGHWTCPESLFIESLEAQQIELLVDIRAHPGSRRSPQFARDAMPQWLSSAGIDYMHLPELGGRRAKQDVAGSINDAWQNASFKNYADYSLSEEYERGLAKLAQLAEVQQTVMMCSEPMPWRCHRLLVSNTLTARGWTVWHIMSGSTPRLHELGAWGAAPVVGSDGQVTYPADAAKT